MTAPSATRRARPALIPAIAALLVTVVPASVSAFSQEELARAEEAVVQGVNDTRATRGLRPLLVDPRVRDVARDRSGSMARLDYFAHVSPDGIDASDLMRRRDIRHYAWGEAIGWNGEGTIEGSVERMLAWWRGSGPHLGLMVSTTYNYVGVGVAQDDDRLLYTIVFIQGPDRTSPVVSVQGVSTANAEGATSEPGAVAATLHWSGADRPLAVLTAGLRGFTLQRQRPDGTWRTVLSDTTLRSRTFTLASGEHHFRLRSTDRNGNRSRWTPAVEVLVP